MGFEDCRDIGLLSFSSGERLSIEQSVCEGSTPSQHRDSRRNIQTARIRLDAYCSLVAFSNSRLLIYDIQQRGYPNAEERISATHTVQRRHGPDPGYFGR